MQSEAVDLCPECGEPASSNHSHEEESNEEEAHEQVRMDPDVAEELAWS